MSVMPVDLSEVKKSIRRAIASLEKAQSASPKATKVRLDSLKAAKSAVQLAIKQATPGEEEPLS